MALHCIYIVSLTNICAAPLAAKQADSLAKLKAWHEKCSHKKCRAIRPGSWLASGNDAMPSIQTLTALIRFKASPALFGVPSWIAGTILAMMLDAL